VIPADCPSATDPPVPSPQIVPGQEAGSAPARTLPYQLTASSSADCLLSRFYITMTNAGTASAHIAIYANAFRSDGPWQYDIGPGGAVTDYFSAGLFGGGKYDLTAYGPNGFQRRFAGNLNTTCNELEASAAINPTAGSITLLLRNSSSAAATFTVAANSYLSGGPWSYQVASGTTFSTTFSVATNNNWYDLTVTTSSETSFLRRFAGHVEPAPIIGARPLAFTVSPGLIHFVWTGGTSIKLQTTTNFDSTIWLDIAGTLGANSIDLPISSGTAFFRLAQ
jgi:phospholipase C